MSRTHPLPSHLSGCLYDLIIVGGGINGAGIARDAAMRGMKVALIEQDDFGAGTSGRSGRMIHGGLRYLEYFEFGLVRESLVERRRWLKQAPHLTMSRPLIIPSYATNKHRRSTIALGMIAMTLLSAGCWQGLPEFYGREKTLGKVPGLNPAGLLGSAEMPDAFAVYAERVVLENVLEGELHGATIINHAQCTRIASHGTRVDGVVFRDLLTGQDHELRGGVVINAGGPWVDRVLNGSVEMKKPLVGGTKGTFIALERFAGAPECSLLFETESDHRHMCVLPWGRWILAGSTDITYPGDPGAVGPEPAEAGYILKEMQRLFPAAGIHSGQIRLAFSGVRPLPYTGPGSQSNESITRRHIIKDHAPDYSGLISVYGGKLSTYRCLAQECVDLAARKLERSFPACKTGEAPLLGGRLPSGQSFAQFSDSLAATWGGLDGAIVRRMLGIYGVRSADVLQLTIERPELASPLTQGSLAIGAEIVFALKVERAETLCDVLMRRCMLGFETAFDPEVARNAARIAVREGYWNEQRAEQELDQYAVLASRFMPPQII